MTAMVTPLQLVTSLGGTLQTRKKPLEVLAIILQQVAAPVVDARQALKGGHLAVVLHG
jgi:hypothetical protein